MKKTSLFSICVGLFLLITSIYLAIRLKYNHFYEIMLVGLVLILYPVTKKYFDSKTILKLYFTFLILAGLLGDFVFGIIIGEVWYYNYSMVSEYILLYFLIYPVGGFVMIMSFLLFLGNSQLKNKRKVKFLNEILLTLSSSFIFLVVIFAYLKHTSSFEYSGFFSFVFICLFLCIVFNYIPERKGKPSYLRILLNNPKKFIFATLLATYINALIHEYPNVFAQQWVYQNILFGDIKLIGIPVIVLVGWLVLTILPVSAYYAIKKG
ncbi:MAG: hypothetical protein JSW73_00180 [Candidatus Woesearchaeota archaeon]|nr:MAG: hypothetical protein JSW73_00180 [Candidatus Woesearchaeota archaeon]